MAGNLTVQLRDVDSGKEVKTWQAYAHDMWVWSLAFTPDGRTLLTSGKFAGRLWSVPDGRPVGELMEHDEVFGEVRNRLRGRISPDTQRQPDAL